MDDEHSDKRKYAGKLTPKEWKEVEDFNKQMLIEKEKF